MLCSEESDWRGVWVEEAMHRVSNLQHLAVNLERLIDTGRIDSSNRVRTIRRAEALVRAYQSLDMAHPPGATTCVQELGDIVGGLVEIFGHTVGSLVLSLELQPLVLAGEMRRALLLVASELVVNALRHAFIGRQTGIIQIRLSYDQAAQTGTLSVADDGVGPEGLAEGRGLGRCITRDLAEVLGGEIVWRQALLLGGTEAVVRFPVPIQEAQ